MQETMSNPELANLDLSKVAALQQKRTLAFVNHFVMTTVQFLNSFMKKCEHRLMHFERKLEKVEASMVLLEARLSSIPEVNTVEPETKPEVAVSTTEQADQSSSNQHNNTTRESENTEASKENDTVQMQPEYERFVKMVQVGVPLEAVKLKVSLEGLDTNVFEKLLKK